MRSHSLLTLLLAAITLIAGCADNGREPTYPAGGTVKYKDGRPLAGGSVICESPLGLSARAIIADDGTFQLGTYEDADGAVAGKHRVAIRPPSSLDAVVDGPRQGPRPPGLRIDDRFLDFDKSGIELDVKPDGENKFTIEVSDPSR